MARSRVAVCWICAGGQVGAHLEPAGVQGDQGDAVSEDVVHLAGDPGPFGQPGLLLVQLLVGLGAQHTVLE